LLQKPDVPTPHFEAGSADHQKEKGADVFKPPYNPNLYVGELQDEEQNTGYVVLVSGVISG
jgi:ATP adenylyltransferase